MKEKALVIMPSMAFKVMVVLMAELDTGDRAIEFFC